MDFLGKIHCKLGFKQLRKHASANLWVHLTMNLQSCKKAHDLCSSMSNTLCTQKPENVKDNQKVQTNCMFLNLEMGLDCIKDFIYNGSDWKAPSHDKVVALLQTIWWYGTVINKELAKIPQTKK